jgi:hypothetical protein
MEACGNARATTVAGTLPATAGWQPALPGKQVTRRTNLRFALLFQFINRLQSAIYEHVNEVE